VTGIRSKVGSLQRKLLIAAVPLGLLLVADLVVQHTALRDGVLFGHRVMPFQPPLFSEQHLATFGRLKQEAAGTIQPQGPVRFDAELGWVAQPRVHEFGAGAAARTLVTLGGSFTYGDEVAASESWPAQLAQTGLRVVNLAVPAYGIDQAILRFQHDAEVRDSLRAGDAVWLGVMPRALLRLVNVYRPALRHHGAGVGMKPRFKLTDGQADGPLEKVPNPAASLAELVSLVGNQQAFVDAVGNDDAFIACAPWAYRPAGTHWSHWFAVTRLIGSRLEGKGRDPVAWVDDADSEVFQLTLALCRGLATDAESLGGRARVVILPDHWSLQRMHEAGGRAYWQRLVDALRENGIAVTDVTEALLEAGALDDAAFWMPGGHYSARANRVVADSLAALLAKN